MEGKIETIKLFFSKNPWIITTAGFVGLILYNINRQKKEKDDEKIENSRKEDENEQIIQNDNQTKQDKQDGVFSQSDTEQIDVNHAKLQPLKNSKMQKNWSKHSNHQSDVQVETQASSVNHTPQQASNQSSIQPQQTPVQKFQNRSRFINRSKKFHTDIESDDIEGKRKNRKILGTKDSWGEQDKLFFRIYSDLLSGSEGDDEL